MVKWLGWWIVCLLAGALILIIGLIMTVFFLMGVFWLIDSWAGVFFITVFLCFAVAMGAVLHHKGEIDV